MASPRGRPKGYRMSKKSRRKTSRSRTGQTHTQETKDKIAASLVRYFNLTKRRENGMIEGKRILADPKFNVLDGSWDDRDFAKFNHALYGIMPADIYSCFEAGSEDRRELIPSYVCDSYFKHRPPELHLRDKRQPTIASRLYYYRENPRKVRTLHKYLLSKVNEQRLTCGMPKLAVKKAIFNIKAFTTISPCGHRCSWSITTKTKDKNNQPIKYPILMKIDGIDACLFKHIKVASIADKMVYDECKMKKRVINRPVCELSAMAK